MRNRLCRGLGDTTSRDLRLLLVQSFVFVVVLVGGLVGRQPGNGQEIVV